MTSGKNRDHRRLPAWLCAVTLLAFVAVSCGDDDMPPPPANVMFVHASPGAPEVDILVDGQKYHIDPPLAFLENTKYLSVSAGTRNVKVNEAGTATTVIDVTLPYGSRRHYSVFAVDVPAEIAPLRLDDDLTLPGEGEAHVRFVHLSPDAPAVDITLTDGTVIFGDTAFKGFTEFTPVTAGTYDLQVRLAGTNDVVLVLPPIPLVEGEIYTIFAKGLLDGTGDQELGAVVIVNKGDEAGLCFIATAAFGTRMAGKIDVLKDLRDGYLVTSLEGRAIVDAYYRISPPIAQYIAGSGWLKAAVRVLLLPVVGLGSLFV